MNQYFIDFSILFLYFNDIFEYLLIFHILPLFLLNKLIQSILFLHLI